MLFQRRPSGTIEAEQLIDPSDTLPRGVKVSPDGASLYVTTIQGVNVIVKPGEWILPEPDGEHFYPCSNEEFKARYEPAINATGKTLHNSDISGARVNVPDIKVVGNGDAFQLLCKASSAKEGWMKSTKAMDVGTGCLVQVTTQQRNADGSYAVAEALAYVPDVFIADDVNNGRTLRSRSS